MIKKSLDKRKIVSRVYLQTKKNKQQNEMKTTEKQTVVAKKSVKRGRPPQISFSGIRWDRMTNAEIAKKLWDDPKNKGKIKASSIKNFVVTVFLKRKKLVANGQKAAFAGRSVVAKDGTRKVKTKWVQAKK